MSVPIRYISPAEQISLSSVAGILVIIVIGLYIHAAVLNIYNDATFAWVPPFHVMSFLLFVSLALGRKFYLALIITVFYVAALLYVTHLTIVLQEQTYYSSATIEGYINAGAYWLMVIPVNLFALIFLLPLLVWEISIVLRVVRQTLNASKLA